MKKIAWWGLLAYLSLSVHAQIFTTRSGNFHLSAESSLGIVYGAVGEYVYEKDSDGKYQKLSYLEWQEHPLVVQGETITLGYKRFCASVQIDFALPVGCGNMEDSDWLNVSDRAMKTTFSVSDNAVGANIDTHLTLSYAFYPKNWLIVSPLASAGYTYRSFSATNAAGWYGQYRTPMVAWDDAGAVYYPSGTLGSIDYDRFSLTAYIGGNVQLQLPYGFSFYFSVAVSPFTYVESVDKHYYTSGKVASDWLDVAYCWFSRIKAELALYYRLNPYVSVGLTCSELAGWLTQGATHLKHNDGRYYESSVAKSGADIYETTVRLTCRVSFF